MAATGALIESKVKAFAKALNKELDTARAKKVAELKKAGSKDPEKELVTVSFALSKRKVTMTRSPEDQAKLVSKGSSWTCSGAHVADSARHVDMSLGAPGKKASGPSWDLKTAFGSGKSHFMKESDLKTKWNKLMSAQGLKNFKGKDGWGAGDVFHFELPESKIPISDKRVQACLLHYATITRKDGKKQNSKFEGSSYWSKALKPHLDKIAKEKKK